MIPSLGWDINNKEGDNLDTNIYRPTQKLGDTTHFDTSATKMVKLGW